MKRGRHCEKYRPSYGTFCLIAKWINYCVTIGYGTVGSLGSSTSWFGMMVVSGYSTGSPTLSGRFCELPTVKFVLYGILMIDATILMTSSNSNRWAAISYSTPSKVNEAVFRCHNTQRASGAAVDDG